jgi:hypothetical protein
MFALAVSLCRREMRGAGVLVVCSVLPHCLLCGVIGISQTRFQPGDGFKLGDGTHSSIYVYMVRESGASHGLDNPGSRVRAPDSVVLPFHARGCPFQMRLVGPWAVLGNGDRGPWPRARWLEATRCGIEPDVLNTTVFEK